jgi:aryl-alcohol dehydrogenase-like predicted oxidoreductase
VIPGSKSIEHMRENAAASEAPDLTTEELARIAHTRAALT